MAKAKGDSIYQQEAAYAEQLATLPVEVQRQAVALIRSPALDPKVGKRDRDAATERADALERHLRRLNRQKKKPK